MAQQGEVLVALVLTNSSSNLKSLVLSWYSFIGTLKLNRSPLIFYHGHWEEEFYLKMAGLHLISIVLHMYRKWLFFLKIDNPFVSSALKAAAGVSGNASRVALTDYEATAKALAQGRRGGRAAGPSPRLSPRVATEARQGCAVLSCPLCLKLELCCSCSHLEHCLWHSPKHVGEAGYSSGLSKFPLWEPSIFFVSIINKNWEKKIDQNPLEVKTC